MIMRKKKLPSKPLWKKFKRFFSEKAYAIYRKFHTTARVRNVLFITIFIGVLLGVVVFVPGIKEIWPAFFGALTNTLLGIFAGSLYVLVRVIFEDQHKVTQDCKELYKYYGHAYDNCFRMKEEGDLFQFVYDADLDTFITSIEFKTHPESYELPSFVQNHYDEIFAAHRGSYKANSQTVRLHHYDLVDGKLTLHVQKSTFYNHLVTNRAIDLPVNKSLTLRDMYEPGPKLNALSKSKLSNHIGVIGLVVTKNNQIVLFHRSNSATTSKNKLTSTIAIGLKVPENYIKSYDRKEIIETTEFEKNIHDVLFSNTYIKPNNITKLDYLGIGRDVYEGGKPHLFLAVHINLTALELVEQFKAVQEKELEEKQAVYDKHNSHLKQYKVLQKNYMKNPTNESIESIHNFEDTLLRNSQLEADDLIDKERKKQLDRTNEFYIIDPLLMDFFNDALVVEGISQDGLKITKTLVPESSLLMNLYFYHKRNLTK